MSDKKPEIYPFMVRLFGQPDLTTIGSKIDLINLLEDCNLFADCIQGMSAANSSIQGIYSGLSAALKSRVRFWKNEIKQRDFKGHLTRIIHERPVT